MYNTNLRKVVQNGRIVTQSRVIVTQSQRTVVQNDLIVTQSQVTVEHRHVMVAHRILIAKHTNIEVAHRTFHIAYIDLRELQTNFYGVFSRRTGKPVSYTHLRAHETRHDLVCR